MKHYLLATLILLTACGGGSGTNPPNTKTPTPTTDPIISISGISQRTAGFITATGTSKAITGNLTLSVGDQSYSVEIASNGSWQFSLSSCEARLDNGAYTLSVSQGATSSSKTFSVTHPAQEITLNYYRVNGDYSDWGVHLWGNAIANNTSTSWALPRSFDCKNSAGWASFYIPIINSNEIFNFILHKGDAKNTPQDQALLPSTWGNNVFVVQNQAVFYKTLSDADVAINQLGSASTLLDLSQVNVGDTTSTLAKDWANSATFMEIYVRGYKDSDGDGIGDLAGLTEKLPYLKTLGINGLWLMPITESSDNDHGYAVTNYRDIEDDYGTLQDFQTLLHEAHQLGIGIIIDYVVNHASAANPLFLDASFSRDNDKRDWFTFSQTDLGWGPWGNAWRESDTGFYYAPFDTAMPDFNLNNSDVVEFHKNNLKFWLNMGVDGFRFDAVGVLFENSDGSGLIDNPTNHVFLASLAETIHHYDNRFVVCEGPDDPHAYAQNSSCGRAFAFGTQYAILESVRDGQVNQALLEQLQHPLTDKMPLFLSNHDSFAGARPTTYFSKVASLSSERQLQALKTAAAISILSSATPFIYYGEDVGQVGDNTSDWELRRPMSWTDNAENAGFTSGKPFRPVVANVSTNNVLLMEGDNSSLLAHYHQLNALKVDNKTLSLGTLDIQSSQNDSVLFFTRTLDHEQIIVAINLDQQPKTFNVKLLTKMQYRDVMGNSTDTLTSTNGELSLELMADEIRVLRSQ